MNSVGTPQRKTLTSPFAMARKESSPCLSHFLLLQSHENHDLNIEGQHANKDIE